jgi:hypothetical protein
MKEQVARDIASPGSSPPSWLVTRGNCRNPKLFFGSPILEEYSCCSVDTVIISPARCLVSSKKPDQNARLTATTT